MKYYAGIGSRQTPPDMLSLISRLATYLRAKGWILRSGHADGADWAFEQEAGPKSIIYLPWNTFNQQPYKNSPGYPVLGTPVCQSDWWVRSYHNVLVPRGIHNSSNPTHHKLHGRNVAQVYGTSATGDTEVCSKFVVCWCPVINNQPQDGTATAVKLATQLGIPVFNLFLPDDRNRIELRLNQN